GNPFSLFRGEEIIRKSLFPFGEEIMMEFLHIPLSPLGERARVRGRQKISPIFHYRGRGHEDNF
ncbi:MAG: hypothetical protein Q8N91_05205, partial [Candidatus Omnitrophota bacterium]|nr:hypothetical protein [Candidatus Omnitrophota bacterium]